MKKSPQKLIQLSLLLFAVLGVISCSNDHDLIAEYVLSDTLNTENLEIPLDEANAPLGNIHNVLSEESRSDAVPTTQTAIASQGTVEIDHMTNTLIYTPARILLNAIPNPVVKTLSK